jgi:hypothetical protein
MADIQVTPVTVSRAGATITGQAMIAADSYYVLNDGTTCIFMTNAIASPATVTIYVTGDLDGLTPVNRTVTVPASTNLMIGAFQPELYNQKTGTQAGRVRIGTTAALTMYASKA